MKMMHSRSASPIDDRVGQRCAEGTLRWLRLDAEALVLSDRHPAQPARDQTDAEDRPAVEQLSDTLNGLASNDDLMSRVDTAHSSADERCKRTPVHVDAEDVAHQSHSKVASRVNRRGEQTSALVHETAPQHTPVELRDRSVPISSSKNIIEQRVIGERDHEGETTCPKQ